MKNKQLKVLFVGNSITLHAKAPQIGWNNFWGMAASAEDKDYVHLCEKHILERFPEAEFQVAQVFDWERKHREGPYDYGYFTPYREFGADIIVMRIVENIPQDQLDPALFERCYGEFIDYLKGNPNAKILVTTGFWKHACDRAIRHYAEENGAFLAELGDLGEKPEMRAGALFEHPGVAAHPGDAGMQAIADRIIVQLDKILAEEP